MTFDDIIKWIKKDMLAEAKGQPHQLSDELKLALMQRINVNYNHEREQELVHYFTGDRTEYIVDLDELSIATRAERRVAERKILAGEQKSTQEKEIAIKYLNQLPANTTQHEPQVRGTWNIVIDYFQNRQNIGQTLHTVIKKTFESFMLNNNIMLRYETGHVSNAIKHRLKSFGSVEGFLPMRNRFNINTPTKFCALLTYSIGVSFFNPLSRKPLDIKSQKQFFENFSTVTTVTNERGKNDLISKIISRYGEAHRFSNNSYQSNYLLDILKHEANTTLNKWDAILDYMAARDGDYLINNGKKLFRYIESVINEFLEVNLSQTLTRRLMV